MTQSATWMVPVGRTALGRRHRAHLFTASGLVMWRSSCGGWLLTRASVRPAEDSDRRCQWCEADAPPATV